MLARTGSRLLRKFGSRNLIGSEDFVWARMEKNAANLYDDKPFEFKAYHGMMAAGLTAMHEDGLTLDLSNVGKYADDLVSQGVTGNFLNGTSGQSVTLTVAERKET